VLNSAKHPAAVLAAICLVAQSGCSSSRDSGQSPAPTVSVIPAPQKVAVAAGTLILLIAILDELVLEWTGRRVRAKHDAALHHE